MQLLKFLHRFISIGLFVCFCFLFFCLSGCQSQQISADPPDSGQSSTESGDELPSGGEEKSTDEQDPSSGSEVPDSSEEDSVGYEDPLSDVSIAVLGNSMVESLYVYNVLPEANLFYKIGLNVTTVFTKNCVNGTGPAIEELSKKPYDDIILVFGMNELGWNQDTFIRDYTQVIAQVKQYQPEATIYVHSVTPVSDEVSAKAENGITNERVQACNAALMQMAQENGVQYLNADPVFCTQTGSLAPEASVDGIHPEIEYSRRWAYYIRKCLKGVEQQ